MSLRVMSAREREEMVSRAAAEAVSRSAAHTKEMAELEQYREEEKARLKLAKKESRLQRKQEEEERLARKREKEEEEARAQAEADAVERKKLVAIRNLKKSQKKLRGLVNNSVDFDVCDHDLDRVCAYASNTRLTNVCKAIARNGGANGEGKTAFDEAVLSVAHELELTSDGKRGEVLEGTVKKKTAWSEEEMAQLHKALKKFPTGTFNQWERINTVVVTRGVKEIIAKVHSLRGKAAFANQVKTGAAAADSAGSNNDYERSQAKAIKKRGAADIKAELTRDWERDIGSDAGGGADGGSYGGGDGGVDAWSTTQQTALEAGIRRVDSKASDRWTQIAVGVEGKDRRECIARYKFLVKEMAAKRNPTAPAASSSSASSSSPTSSPSSSSSSSSTSSSPSSSKITSTSATTASTSKSTSNNDINNDNNNNNNSSNNNNDTNTTAPSTLSQQAHTDKPVPKQRKQKRTKAEARAAAAAAAAAAEPEDDEDDDDNITAVVPARVDPEATDPIALGIVILCLLFGIYVTIAQPF